MQKTKVKGINGKNTISWVGGFKIPPVDRYGAGYEAGAKAGSPGITVLHGYGDFTTQSKCKSIALSQIAAGSDVVFQVAGGCGLGALDAAKSKGVWGIGVDNDQSGLGAHILTSAIKKVDQAVFLAIKDLGAGKFAAKNNRVFNLKNGGVGIAGTSKGVPAAVLAKVKAAEGRIKAGKVKIPTLVP